MRELIESGHWEPACRFVELHELSRGEGLLLLQGNELDFLRERDMGREKKG